jgi:hypothetical protein
MVAMPKSVDLPHHAYQVNTKHRYTKGKMSRRIWKAQVKLKRRNITIRAHTKIMTLVSIRNVLSLILGFTALLKNIVDNHMRWTPV